MGAYRQYYKQQAKENKTVIKKPTARVSRKPLESNEKIWRPWETPAKEFNCRVSDCDVTFKRESELKLHENTIHDKNTETCTICSNIFTRKDNLTRHMNLKHKSPDHKPKCYYCKKQLSRQDAVQRHIPTCPKNPLKQIQGGLLKNSQKSQRQVFP